MSVDALCKECKKPFRWEAVSVMKCQECQGRPTFRSSAQTINVEDIFTDEELNAIYFAYFEATGDTNIANVEQVLRDAAAIRFRNQNLEKAIRRKLGIVLMANGKISFVNADTGSMDS